MRTNSRNRETTNFLFKLFQSWFGHFAWNQPQRKMSARSRGALMLRAKQFHVLADSDAHTGWLASEMQAAKFNYLRCRRLQKACTNRKNPIIISPASYLERVQQPIIDPKTFSSLLSARWTFACSALSTFPFKLSQARDLARWVIAKNKLIRQKA